MIRVCMIGLGRTGKEIAKVLLQADDIQLTSAVVSPGSEKKGKDLGEVLEGSYLGIPVEDAEELESILIRTCPDVVVDFSCPEASLRNARICSKLNISIVIGTTGFTKEALSKLYGIGNIRRNGIVYAPNITLGVNVLMLVTNLASSLLSAYDFQITETHHRNKKDSPSGTATKIAREIEKGIASSDSGILKKIPIQSIRAGGVVGKHEVLIVGDDDQIQISHESFSRKIFGAGAVKAVHFLVGKKGYFEMSDVLDLPGVLEHCLSYNHQNSPMPRKKKKEKCSPSHQTFSGSTCS